MGRNVRVKVRMNHRVLKQLSDTQIKALEMTAEAVKTDVMTAGVVPKDKGELERSAFIDDSKKKRGKVKLVYDTPYARRLYYHPEYHFRQDNNPNAKGKWLENWISGKKKRFASNAFRTFYRKLNGGVVK